MWKVLRLVLGKKHVSAWAITLPAIVQKEQRYFTPEEMVKIIDAAEGQFKSLFALQYAAGMRFGEVAGLHVEDLDFDNSLSTFDGAFTFTKKRLPRLPQATEMSISIPMLWRC